MKIERVRVVARSTHLARPVKCAAGVWRERRSLAVEIIDEDERRGLGEASPLPGYSPDTLDGCLAVLESFAARPRQCLDLTSPLPLEVERTLAAIPRAFPAARFAVETAILDVVGQRLGRPVNTLLRPDGAPVPGVPVAHLLFGGSTTELVDCAKRAVVSGRRTLKLKIGGSAFEEDVARADAIRRELGDLVRFRLDANQRLATSLSLLAGRLQRLAAFSPEIVEEPAPLGVLLKLARSPVPIALDETLMTTSPERLAVLAARDFPSAVVLKPMALGGAYRCLEWASAARDRGVEVIVSHLFDGPIAHAAASNLALALSSSSGLAQGLDVHPAVLAWGGASPVHLDGARIRSLSEPGLGLAREEIERVGLGRRAFESANLVRPERFRLGGYG